jgi:hypothetical protein
MAKPSVALVKAWYLEEETDYTELACGTAVFDGDYYRVRTRDGKAKYFYGETAWSDARRYAGDLEWTLSRGDN